MNTELDQIFALVGKKIRYSESLSRVLFGPTGMGKVDAVLMVIGCVKPGFEIEMINQSQSMTWFGNTLEEVVSRCLADMEEIR